MWVSYLSVHHVYAVLTERVRYTSTGVADVWEPPCGCWEQSLSPLQEQPVVLNSESLSALIMQFLSIKSNGLYFL